MKRNKVDLAAIASINKVLKPGETRLAAAVGNGRGAELDALASKHVRNVGLVGGSGSGGIDVALGVKIGFVKAHKMSATGVDSFLCVRLPAAGQGFAVAPEQGYVFDVARDVAAIA